VFALTLPLSLAFCDLLNMEFSPDDNPLIGELPSYPSEYVMAGYTGYGMPIAFGTGQAIAQMIIGQEPKLPDSLSPKRFRKFQ
jgi:sarcosine oxidase subunit beta